MTFINSVATTPGHSALIARRCFGDERQVRAAVTATVGYSSQLIHVRLSSLARFVGCTAPARSSVRHRSISPSLRVSQSRSEQKRQATIHHMALKAAMQCSPALAGLRIIKSIVVPASALISATKSSRGASCIPLMGHKTLLPKAPPRRRTIREGSLCDEPYHLKTSLAF